MYQNPKKELTINFSVKKVREAILKLQKKDCVLIKDDKTLNEITLHDKDALGTGYIFSFIMVVKEDEITNVTIEVTKNLIGSISTAKEQTLGTNKLKRITHEFSAYLSGDVDEKTGKPNVPKQGCMVTTLLMVGSIGIGGYSLLSYLIG